MRRYVVRTRTRTTTIWVSSRSVCDSRRSNASRDSRVGSPSSHRHGPSRAPPRVDDTSFQPAEILAALERHGVRYVVIGGLAATLHGSPVVTTDADICPARDRDNLDRLANALKELRARIRTADVSDGLAFACDAAFLSRIEVALNLTTRFGDLDVSIVPSGTSGFEDLRQQAVTISLAGHPVAVASLEDVIRSKEAANRPKDQAALPTLRLLLRRLRKGAT